mmetsp:Transcript_8359/g.52105  ORF Transcript_8359/g.52105 Transcript_8359/m.52105 type:complete len:150 (+) Transcript_8359:1643-2092(+)
MVQLEVLIFVNAAKRGCHRHGKSMEIDQWDQLMQCSVISCYKPHLKKCNSDYSQSIRIPLDLTHICWEGKFDSCTGTRHMNLFQNENAVEFFACIREISNFWKCMRKCETGETDDIGKVSFKHVHDGAVPRRLLQCKVGACTFYCLLRS